jgi:hypothetical protein
MTKMSQPSQSDVDEAALDGAQLVQELGLGLDDVTASKVAGRKAVLMAHAGLVSLMVLFDGPISEGWKR